MSDIQIASFVFICYNMRHILEKQERSLICQRCVTDKWQSNIKTVIQNKRYQKARQLVPLSGIAFYFLTASLLTFWDRLSGNATFPEHFKSKCILMKQKSLSTLGYIMEQLNLPTVYMAQSVHVDASLVSKWKLCFGKR